MPPWARPLLIWLLAFALPMQAVAGSLLQLCRAHHAALTAAAGPAPDADGHAQGRAGDAGHGPVHAGDHGGSARTADAATAVDADVAPSPGVASSDTPGSAAACTECAAACAVSALPPPVAGVDVAPPGERWACATAAQVRAFVNPAPERPPRSAAV